jgi:hypothetical protein
MKVSNNVIISVVESIGILLNCRHVVVIIITIPFYVHVQTLLHNLTIQWKLVLLFNFFFYQNIWYIHNNII